MNQDNFLAHLRFRNETWTPSLTVISDDNEPPLSGIANMAALAPYVSPTQLYLFYLTDHRPQLTIIMIDDKDVGEGDVDSEDDSAGLGTISQAPYALSELPNAIQAPALIAAGATVYEGALSLQSVFYVWKSSETAIFTAPQGPQGSVIVNMTGTQDEWAQESWNASSASGTGVIGL